MKTLNSFTLALVLAVAFWLGSANQSAARQPKYYSGGGDGVLRIKHSPVLGTNIPVAVWIDGRQAGTFTKGHVYQRFLSPGRHMIRASRPGLLYGSWQGSLNVQPGQTYSFVVKSSPNGVVLESVRSVH
ncbi:MAG TPA: hypothetical protein VM940_15985 [Chthoniobacterales bacterium]|jgi:hypothetical protein|nr:hypothetical protein [Chthoniobacterales bacterium]